MLALVFFWLVGHARLQRYVLAFLPPERRAAVRDGWNEVETRLGLWVRGQLTLMGIVGIASGIAYVLLGVPAALLLGLVAGICEGIPLVGPILGAVPAVIAAATVSPELALVVVGVAAVIQLVENNLLVPVIMRNTIGISPLILTVSLLIGAAAGGIIGALIAVPIAAALEVILGRLQDRDSPVVQDPAAIEASTDPATMPAARCPTPRAGSRPAEGVASSYPTRASCRPSVPEPPAPATANARLKPRRRHGTSRAPDSSACTGVTSIVVAAPTASIRCPGGPGSQR